jgi:hypothetical protein
MITGRMKPPRPLIFVAVIIDIFAQLPDGSFWQDPKADAKKAQLA